MDGAGWLSRFVIRNRLPLVVVLAVVVLGGLILWISDARGGGQQVGAAAPSVEYRQSAAAIQRGGQVAPSIVPVPGPVMRILPTLTQRGEQRFPEVYGGLRLTDRGTRVEVFLTT